MSEREVQVESAASGLLKPPTNQLAPSVSPSTRRHSTFLQTGASSRRGSQATGTLMQPLAAAAGASGRRRMTMRRGTREHLQLSRGSVFSESSMGAPTACLENTYQTEPKETQAFRPGQAERIMREVLEQGLEGQTYSETSTPLLACTLTQRLKDALKRLQCTRHKLICYVVVGQDKNQGAHMASQCVWTPDTDSYVTVTVSNASLFAVATAYALYFE